MHLGEQEESYAQPDRGLLGNNLIEEFTQLWGMGLAVVRVVFVLPN